MASGRPAISFASRTNFEALAVDSGEESEAEVTQAPNFAPESVPQTQAKPSKSAQKKAAKASRLEKKAKAARSPGAEDSPASVTSSPKLPQVPLEAVPDPVVKVVTAERPAPKRPTTLTESKPQSSHANHSVDHGPQRATEQNDLNQKALPRPSPVVLVKSPGSDSREVRPLQLAGLAKGDTQQPQKPSLMKEKRVVTRTLWTFIMIGVFLGLLLLGHAYMILLVILCQTLVYREVTALFSLKGSKPDLGSIESKGKDPWSKTLNWYFFAVTNYFLYGESIIYYFKHVVFADAQLLPFATNHRIISFMLYTIGFVGFVMSLKKGYLKQQFGLFCWVHMSLLLIVLSSHFIVNNILEGLIWFWVPASLVICNDVFAFVWGITVGRTPLFKLSPSKTVEGFVGAFWSTVLFGILWGTYFMQYDYMICPVHDLGISAWSGMMCTPNPIFVWREWQIWSPVAVFLSTLLGRSVTAIPYAPYHFHLLCMSCFASLVAPFGGFFASGFKRAFDVKDFGDSIPGHGGMTDRMDCQFLMGVFTYVWYSSLIREHHVTVGSILQTIVSGLTVDQQLDLIRDLRKYLAGQGISID